MKNTIITLSMILITGISNSQEVISSQGNSYSNGASSIDFTIGEVIIDTGTDGSTTITQGFHQTIWNVVGIEDHIPDFEVLVFPNPIQDQLHIKTDNFNNVNYRLFDAKGRLIMADELKTNLTQLEVSQLTMGAYILQFYDQNQQSLKTIKLTKNN